MITYQDADIETISDLFSKTLRRKVLAKVEGGRLNLYFDGSGITIRSNNTEAAYKKGSQIILSWPARMSKMELVFGLENDELYKGAAAKQMGGYFELRKSQHIREYKL